MDQIEILIEQVSVAFQPKSICTRAVPMRSGRVPIQYLLVVRFGRMFVCNSEHTLYRKSYSSFIISWIMSRSLRTAHAGAGLETFRRWVSSLGLWTRSNDLNLAFPTCCRIEIVRPIPSLWLAPSQRLSDVLRMTIIPAYNPQTLIPVISRVTGFAMCAFRSVVKQDSASEWVNLKPKFVTNCISSRAWIRERERERETRRGESNIFPTVSTTPYILRGSIALVIIYGTT